MYELWFMSMRNSGNFSGTKMVQRQHVDEDAEEKVKSLVGSILFSSSVPKKLCYYQIRRQSWF